MPAFSTGVSAGLGAGQAIFGPLRSQLNFNRQFGLQSERLGILKQQAQLQKREFEERQKIRNQLFNFEAQDRGAQEIARDQEIAAQAVARDRAARDVARAMRAQATGIGEIAAPILPGGSALPLPPPQLPAAAVGLEGLLPSPEFLPRPLDSLDAEIQRALQFMGTPRDRAVFAQTLVDDFGLSATEDVKNLPAEERRRLLDFVRSSVRPFGRSQP